MVRMVEKLGKLVEEIREKEEFMAHPEIWEAINTIEDDEVFSLDADSLNIIGNVEVEDGELNRLLDELYDVACLRAETWEFAMALERGTPAEGPTLEVEAGRVTPVWDGETLSMDGVDEYLHAELLTVDEGEPDPDMIMEEIDEYMGGD